MPLPNPSNCPEAVQLKQGGNVIMHSVDNSAEKLEKLLAKDSIETVGLEQN